MVSFLLLAQQLISKAEVARDQGLSEILRKSNPDWDREGDPIPF